MVYILFYVAFIGYKLMLQQWKHQITQMESKLRNSLLFLPLAFSIIRLRGEDGVVQGQNNVPSLKEKDLSKANVESLEKNNGTNNEVDVSKKRGKNSGGGAGGGGVGWGWGGGGGGANGRGAWGWGNGGGGGVYWRWGCNRGRGKRGQRSPKTRVFPDDEYKMGEFAQCMVKGRCRGMRLDCPLHCGGPCVYDCRHMCKAHCKR